MKLILVNRNKELDIILIGIIHLVGSKGKKTLTSNLPTFGIKASQIVALPELMDVN